MKTRVTRPSFCRHWLSLLIHTGKMTKQTNDSLFLAVHYSNLQIAYDLMFAIARLLGPQQSLDWTMCPNLAHRMCAWTWRKLTLILNDISLCVVAVVENCCCYIILLRLCNHHGDVLCLPAKQLAPSHSDIHLYLLISCRQIHFVSFCLSLFLSLAMRQTNNNQEERYVRIMSYS